jgi:hypothetical protein
MAKKQEENESRMVSLDDIDALILDIDESREGSALSWEEVRNSPYHAVFRHIVFAFLDEYGIPHEGERMPGVYFPGDDE